MIHRITGKTERFDHLFFDLDGTITESGPGILNAVRHMFDRIGFREDDEERLRGFIGPPVVQYLQQAYGFPEDEARRAYGIFREYYDSRGVFENRLYDGIAEAIEDIRRSGKTVYIATAKPDFFAVPILKRFGILHLFERVFAARHEMGIMDKMQVMRYVADEMGPIPYPAMVGDRRYDIEGGLSVGYATVGVLYGYGSRRELVSAGCDYLLDNVADLPVLLGGTE